MIEHVVGVAIAYLGANRVSVDSISSVLVTIRDAIAALTTPISPVVELVPAVPIKRSIHPDHLVCLEDGRKMKMLKRYLQRAYGLTPDQYREKWGLPHDYPMVSADSSSRRSLMAKNAGFGTGDHRRRGPSRP